MIASTLPVLRDIVEMYTGEPPEGSGALARELQHFCYRHHAVGRDNESNADNSRSMQLYKDKWERHLAIWNGSFAATDVVHTWTPGPVDREDNLRK